MTGFQRISSVQEIDQLAKLWDKLRSMQFTAEADSIRWKMAPNGAYSAGSAYTAQFIQVIPQPLFSTRSGPLRLMVKFSSSRGSCCKIDYGRRTD